MTDLATWTTGGISAIAALVAVYFAARATRAQRAAVVAQQEATAAAREAAESVDKAQRLQIRPALHIELQQEPGPYDADISVTLKLVARNVGHGTAVIERVRLFQYGNPGIEYHDTRGFEQKLIEQFDDKIFVPLAGLSMVGAPAELVLPPLMDSTRALEPEATRTIFALRIGTPGFENIVRRFREGMTAQVIYQSLAKEVFNTDRQFADLREPGRDGRARTRGETTG